MSEELDPGAGDTVTLTSRLCPSDAASAAWFRLCLPLAVSPPVHTVGGHDRAGHVQDEIAGGRIAITAVNLGPLPHNEHTNAAAPVRTSADRSHGARSMPRAAKEQQEFPTTSMTRTGARRTVSSRRGASGPLGSNPRHGKIAMRIERSRTGYRRHVKVSAFHLCHIVQRRGLRRHQPSNSRESRHVIGGGLDDDQHRHCQDRAPRSPQPRPQHEADEHSQGVHVLNLAHQ